ncbi:MAG: PadR family transcriptional regulator [Nitriliruptorales bacterium]|nr:PadR family transcriptional regulator [Nitriliruptorales bacterium]
MAVDDEPVKGIPLARSEELTPTSYALLCFMGLGPFSTYELSFQMTRGLQLFWPRVDRAFYYEAKKLARRGLATARVERDGRRKRTMYTITAEGRRAVRDWLASREISPPRMECEAVLRIWFAENGTADDLRAAASSLVQEAEDIVRTAPERATEFLATGGPYPDRIHLNTLIWRYAYLYGQMLLDYGRWVEQVVADWDRTDDRFVWPDWRAVIEADMDLPDRLDVPVNGEGVEEAPAPA